MKRLSVLLSLSLLLGLLAAPVSAQPKEVVILPGWDFLRPLGPVRPQRNTREEPPKTMEPGAYKFPRQSA